MRSIAAVWLVAVTWVGVSTPATAQASTLRPARVARRGSSAHTSVPGKASSGDSGAVPSSPVDPDVVQLVQPDGSTFAARPWGDASNNGYEDLKGYTVERDPGGTWRYVSGLTSAGAPQLAPQRADLGTVPAGVPAHLRPASPSSGDSGDGQAPASGSHVPHLGTEHVLVIMAEFADQTSIGTTAAQWHAKYFGATGSVAAYYEDASQSKLHLAPASDSHGTVDDGVVGWVTLPMDHPNTGQTHNPTQFEVVREAVIAADPYVDFGSYDANDNGVLEPSELHVSVITAGYETAYGGEAVQCGNSIWAHRGSIAGTVTPPTVDAVSVGGAGYTEFGEWHCKTTTDDPGHAATMGVIAHELGHDLDLPDLYDTDASSSGIGYWSLMASGIWTNLPGQPSGSLPAGLDPFSKMYEGWDTPTQVSGPNVAVALTQAETTHKVIQVLANPGGVDWNKGVQSGTGEYFLIENRQKVGFDAALPGCGVLVWHVNEAVTSGNGANANESNPLINLEEADGQYHLYNGTNKGDAGDPFPGTSHVTSISDSTTPNTGLRTGDPSGVSVSVPDVACSSTANITVSSPAIATTGYIRATTNPALPADIYIDGIERDSWGLNWVPFPTGTHEVCFDAMGGFVAPACQSVEVLDGQTTSVQGTYAQNGYLRVLSDPALPSTILVNGVARNEWGMWSGVPAGTYHVCFGEVQGFDVPACRDVAVTAGATSTTTGTFTSNPSAPGPSGSPGYLRVTTNPPVAAVVSVDGSPRNDWGLDWLKVPAGSHQVCFGKVPNFIEPASCSTAVVTSGATTTITGNYVQKGFLRVLTSPALAATISVDGASANVYGVWTGKPAGTHTVCFSDVVGYVTPACQNNVSVTGGALTTVTGTYTASP